MAKISDWQMRPHQGGMLDLLLCQINRISVADVITPINVIRSQVIPGQVIQLQPIESVMSSNIQPSKTLANPSSILILVSVTREE